MKRKRGHKKGKSKGPPVVVRNEASVNAMSVNTEDNSGLDGYGNDTKYDSGMEVDTPSSTGTDQPHNVASIKPDGSIDKAVGKSVGRVKVKLRTSKTLESHHTSSDALTQSDTDKSSQQLGLEGQGVGMEKMEDSANSLPIGVLGNPAKRAGSIKIKSSKVSGNSGVGYQSSSAVVAQGENPRQEEPKVLHQDGQYIKQELDAALMVCWEVRMNVCLNYVDFKFSFVISLFSAFELIGVFIFPCKGDKEGNENGCSRTLQCPCRSYSSGNSCKYGSSCLLKLLMALWSLKGLIRNLFFFVLFCFIWS